MFRVSLIISKCTPIRDLPSSSDEPPKKRRKIREFSKDGEREPNGGLDDWNPMPDMGNDMEFVAGGISISLVSRKTEIYVKP